MRKDHGLTSLAAAVGAVFCLEEQEALGNPVECLIPPEYRERHRQSRRSYFAAGTPGDLIGNSNSSQHTLPAAPSSPRTVAE